MIINSTIFKKILIVILLLLAGLIVRAQDPFIVVVGSSHLYQVTQNDINNQYVWEVYTDEACSPGCRVLESPGTFNISGTGNAVTIKWLSAGTYYLLLTERNHIGDGDCENYTQKKITVLDADMKISFVNTNKYYCADDSRDSINVKLNFVPVLHSSKHYPLQVTYECSFNGKTKIVTKEVQEDNILSIEYDSLDGFRERMDKDNYQVLTFIKIVDKYGAEVIPAGIVEYTWGAYVRPPVTKINNK